ncbi:hypothetical protein M231_01854 [Tremella mesenterica]|uniref:Uncharacterized protein n=1 Tax=Tremella mesenterica TaxID=5217 RepID=A0A4Q1BS28_TREME|nr:uncharacterized protein TREMEDRAFT_58330 [Tremella mesenterica DSM 1558]EIW72175.1 hypothetical protein TREMEDRAFT_58330 [Tremella mesenterica DSM 1558]RXK40795.1 hypothetical protein M231_01854 [Tremella mesenterica]
MVFDELNKPQAKPSKVFSELPRTPFKTPTKKTDMAPPPTPSPRRSATPSSIRSATPSTSWPDVKPTMAQLHSASTIIKPQKRAATQPPPTPPPTDKKPNLSALRFGSVAPFTPPRSRTPSTPRSTPSPSPIRRMGSMGPPTRGRMRSVTPSSPSPRRSMSRASSLMRTLTTRASKTPTPGPVSRASSVVSIGGSSHNPISLDDTDIPSPPSSPSPLARTRESSFSIAGDRESSVVSECGTIISNSDGRHIRDSTFSHYDGTPQPFEEYRTTDPRVAQKHRRDPDDYNPRATSRSSSVSALPLLPPPPPIPERIREVVLVVKNFLNDLELAASSADSSLVDTSDEEVKVEVIHEALFGLERVAGVTKALADGDTAVSPSSIPTFLFAMMNAVDGFLNAPYLEDVGKKKDKGRARQAEWWAARKDDVATHFRLIKRQMDDKTARRVVRALLSVWVADTTGIVDIVKLKVPACDKDMAAELIEDIKSVVDVVLDLGWPRV